MTVLQAVEALLKEHWQESISGRPTDVPKPDIVVQKDVSKEALQTSDSARVVDGGTTTFEPRGFGWTHERVEADVVVELRAADRRIGGNKIDGRERVFGDRDGTSSPDRHAGLAGETRRILQAHRKGFAEFDRLIADEINDESAAEGQNIYRADVAVALIQDASQIDPSP